MAHSLSPQRTARLLQAPGRQAGGLPAAEPQRVPAFGQGLRRQAAADSRDQDRFPGPRRPNCWPRWCSRASSTKWSRRKTARSCSRRFAHGARSTRTMPTRRATTAPSSAATRRIPAVVWAREPVPGQIIGLSDILRSRLWSRLTSFALYEFQTTMFQPVGGMGRIGEAFVRRSRRPHRLQCQGHQDRAERQRRDGDLRGYEEPRYYRARPAQIGACAPFRSAS